MMHPKHKGAHNELVACQWLLAQGYEVFRSVSASGLFDIMAVRGDKILKIDVKSRTGALRPHQQCLGIAILRVLEDGTCELDLSPGVPDTAACDICGQMFEKHGVQKSCDEHKNLTPVLRARYLELRGSGPGRAGCRIGTGAAANFGET
jgi:hypothetical protein